MQSSPSPPSGYPKVRHPSRPSARSCLTCPFFTPSPFSIPHPDINLPQRHRSRPYQLPLQLPVSRAPSYPSPPPPLQVSPTQGSLQLPESFSTRSKLFSSTQTKTSCPQPSTCLLPSTTSPTTWLPPPLTIPTALPLPPPRPMRRLPVPMKVVGCTLGTSRMRPLRGSSRSSSRTTPCECALLCVFSLRLSFHPALVKEGPSAVGIFWYHYHHWQGYVMADVRCKRNTGLFMCGPSLWPDFRLSCMRLTMPENLGNSG